jgi:hypothetical protein
MSIEVNRWPPTQGDQIIETCCVDIQRGAEQKSIVRVWEAYDIIEARNISTSHDTDANLKSQEQGIFRQLIVFQMSNFTTCIYTGLP